jgi:hypothetical protein
MPRGVFQYTATVVVSNVNAEAMKVVLDAYKDATPIAFAENSATMAASGRLSTPIQGVSMSDGTNVFKINVTATGAGDQLTTVALSSLVITYV